MGSKIIPGVYAEVLLNGTGAPVQDDSLDVLGIIGTFSRGPVNTPTAVADLAQAALLFGDIDNSQSTNFLTGMWAVKLAMDQGASRVVICRIGQDGVIETASLDIKDLVTGATSGAVTGSGSPQAVTVASNPITAGFLVGQTIAVGGAAPEDVVITALSATTITGVFTLSHLSGVSLTQEAVVATVSAPSPGTFGNLYTVQVAAGTLSNTVKLTLTGDGRTEVWDNLTMTPGTPRYLPDFLNANSTLVVIAVGVSPNLPAVLAPTVLSGGDNGNVTADSDYIGVATPAPTGLFALDTQNVNVIVCAGQSSASIHTAMDVHCQAKGDRIAVVGGVIAESKAATLARAAALASDRVVLAFPGIQEFDALANATVKLPSAFTAACIAGRLCTLDPYKSPSNKQIRGILGMEKDTNDADLADLIQGGVMVVTQKGRLGFRIRDGLTTTISFPFNQVNIRRLFDQIVRGVTEGNQDLVSDPNNEDLWHALEQGINDFLDKLKSQGAIRLFYCKVYSSLTDQKAGFLYADVGIFPTYAADFIVIRIKPNDTGSFDTSVVANQ
jgi:phage tail sheath protein FI